MSLLHQQHQKNEETSMGDVYSVWYGIEIEDNGVVGINFATSYLCPRCAIILKLFDGVEVIYGW